MNQTIELLTRHRSIRKFKPDPIPQESLEAILRAAQMASTSSNVQAYSIVGVTDPELKKEIAALAGNQVYIEQCPLFLLWCADLNRNKEACRLQGVEMVSGTMENLLVATIDVALASQNAAVAAESLGLGIVYIGGVRNNPRPISDLVGLPELVYPVFGMCVGYPDQNPDIRPRLATSAVYHENRYDASKARAEIERYDAIMREYYRSRTGGKVDTTWSKGIADKFKQPLRDHMAAFLRDQGFQFDK
jgi:FMN reductase (NADPH)